MTALIVGGLGVPAAAQAAAPPLGLVCTPQNGVRFCPGNGTTQRHLDRARLRRVVRLPRSRLTDPTGCAQAGCT